jgi:CRISPR-associated endonuclease/helicase Cas3
MLFSCLVDADYLDTELHFSGPDLRKGSGFPEIGRLADMFFANHASKFGKGEESSELNLLRCKLFEEAVETAAREPGVYSLTIPTGGGKTRTALGFAFRHAQTHGHRRVIVALPYTSILDQMATEYGKIFGEDNFLLHYSGWQGAEAAWKIEEESAREKKMKLAAENWDASLILTTTVQLFDSIFSNRPGACRKLHNLAHSVIILDEVQTLPMKYWEPICDVLGLLVTQYSATVVLSTATQPALDRVPSFEKRVGKPREIITKPASAYQILKRVKYEIHIDEPWSWDKVADTLFEAGTSGMIIVNTKSHALELFKLVQEKDPDSLHLSTLMCGAHRRRVIEEIKQRLELEIPCRVVSTQLVEAGVDIDFPLVMRAVGPLDRIVQAAGRCNREGKLGREGGRVIVFKPEDNKMPQGSYQTGAGHFEVMYRGEKFIPDDPTTFPAYFARLLQDVDEGVELNKLRKRLMFETVAEKFHLIDRGATRSVFTGYDGTDNKWKGSPAEDLLKRLASTTGEAKRRIYRKLQPFVVEIYQNQVNWLKGTVILEDSATGELYWWGEYDDHVGIAKEQQELDNLFA